MAETEALFLRRTIADLEQRLMLVESSAGSAAPASPLTVPPPAPGPAAPVSTAMPAPFSPPPPVAHTPAATPPPPVQPSPVFPPAPPSAAPPARPTPVFATPSTETLLKWTGLLLVFLAAVFMVSTAIDRGWIGPELQLAGSFAIGGVLVGGGLYLREKRADWGPPLAGVGTTILSMCSVAGWQWLELGAPEIWLAVAVAVHGLALWLTHRFNGPGVAAASTVAAIGSVLWIAEGGPSAAVLATVIALSSMAMSVLLRRPSLHIWASGSSLFAFLILAVVTGIDFPDTAAITLAAGVVVALAMWFMPIAFDLIEPVESAGRQAWVSIARRLPLALPALVAGAIATSASGDLNEGAVYAICGAIALALAGGLYLLVQSKTVLCDQAIWITQALGGLVATVIASALLFDGPGLLTSLIVQSAALLIFIRFVDDRFALVQAAAVTAIASLYGAGRMLYGIDVELDWIDHVVHLLLVGVLAGWAVVEPKREFRRPLGAIAYLAAILWAVPTFIHFEQGQAAISSVWAVLGLAALVAGSVLGSKLAIQGGLATLAIVVLKLLTVDLVDVDTFWRVGLFFVLGGAFLAVSFKFGAGLGRVDSAVEESSPPPPNSAGPMPTAMASAPTPPAPPQRPPAAG